MDGESDAFGTMQPDQKLRSWPARVGVAALNLITPGLGLLRIGKGRAGLVAVVLPSLVIGSLAAIGAVAPTIGFAAFAIVAGLLIVGVVILYVAAIAMTWRGGRVIRPSRWWSSWYALIGFWLAACLVVNGVAALMRQHVYKGYYAPSPSMAPTIDRNDHFLADMRPRQPVRYGDVIVFEANGIVRVDRVVALGGDVVAMQAGIPVINGKAAAQTRRGMITLNAMGVSQGVVDEALPGDTRSHAVLDSGASAFDNTAPVRVPPGALFVLGDNRDMSADSRVPQSELGAGMVPESAVLGRALFIYWGHGSGGTGARLN